ncbi:hypothetical protein PVAP13_4NG260622 [Panicum virgatum]|uniref:Uncharacterized protein n=1 Tax=Panicum virgatum TaxID=38727 RepID=A0A8T0TEM5_PANVG|nr:hypothetical protein PVAP13_4NG260622 [Panicum virgatum]
MSQDPKNTATLPQSAHAARRSLPPPPARRWPRLAADPPADAPLLISEGNCHRRCPRPVLTVPERGDALDPRRQARRPIRRSAQCSPPPPSAALRISQASSNQAASSGRSRGAELAEAAVEECEYAEAEEGQYHAEAGTGTLSEMGMGENSPRWRARGRGSGSNPWRGNFPFRS